LSASSEALTQAQAANTPKVSAQAVASRDRNRHPDSAA
jgi:hypothetical protein